MGRPETDYLRRLAISQLGNGLSEADHHEDALSVREAELSMERRIGAPERDILGAQSNLANTYNQLGRFEEALRVRRDVYSGSLRLTSIDARQCTLVAALNLSTSLVNNRKFAEARAFIRDQMALAKRVHGSDHPTTLDFQWGYARVFILDNDATAEEIAEAAAILEKTLKIAQRVLGREHPSTGYYRHALEIAREQIALRQGA